MATQTDAPEAPRIPLNRTRVLEAAVALADRDGIDAVSMRKLGQELGVEAMSLYNHVKNKGDLLDGMVDTILGEIELTPMEGHWKTAMRTRMLAAREVVIRHQWVPEVLESRPVMTPTMMRYMDSIIGFFREGGVSIDLTHHAMHAIGSRLLGFTQELFDDSDAEQDPAAAAAMMQQLTQFPNIRALTEALLHEGDEIVGAGCDSNFEFRFTIDLILDGIERLHLAEQEG
ncbi:MAG: TetR/AcrR family transcriptional regulator C-terminal domain-containing protein [Acidimicrobiia bacterium]|nr:TetR/AcrR family transcriptional regulator C-terminal domain-containing protein [Acidimicrobiia bacterium]